jgi:DeoR/GlpR family transcriptional regulator of sugar metabolism
MSRMPESEPAPKRRQRLAELVNQSGGARLAVLCSALGASPATVRRDLAELEKTGRLRRFHGGAVSLESRLEEPLFDDKTGIAAREKHRIAQRALEMIGHGETIYLDGGSTVLELARLLRERPDVTVVTNSLRAAQELSGRGPRLILVGGELRRLSQTTVGPLTGAVLEELRPDQAFMGTMGMDAERGLTTSDPNEAHTKRLAMSLSRRVVLLADGGKAGKVAFVRTGGLGSVQVLITDRGADTAFVRRAARLGVKVIRV